MSEVVVIPIALHVLAWYGHGQYRSDRGWQRMSARRMTSRWQRGSEAVPTRLRATACYQSVKYLTAIWLSKFSHRQLLIDCSVLNLELQSYKRLRPVVGITRLFWRLRILETVREHIRIRQYIFYGNRDSMF